MKIQRLYELFDQAMALPNESERDAFLRQQCADAPAERKELESLLKAHAHGHSLLDSPTEAMGRFVSASAEREGQTIGNYKLLQRIGEGGMGVVFMAEQIAPFRRKVAVKIIRDGLNSKQIIARFEAEREALVRLDHSNVTRIFDAGMTEQGHPYFVMELVRGIHITQYCNTNCLSIPDRLKLMEQVCQVIHHAHQKGILHRDIKPSNVMIASHDGVPVPKVIDFGIAKALDRPLTEQTLFTRFGDLVGTPEYMSPEQAEMSGLDLDVRTDIYSLGVLLYQLLTDSTPIQGDKLNGKGLLKIFETIRDSEAELPSLRVTHTLRASETVAEQRQIHPNMLQRFLSGDLDWITMKALAKDRNERYESAAAMARDIRNYLNGEPVDAAAPTFAYRIRKLYTKHRTVSLLALSSAFLLLLSTTFSVYWGIVSYRNGQIAQLQSKQLSSKSMELEDALKRALAAEKQAERLAREERRRGTVERAKSSAIFESIQAKIKDETGFELDLSLPSIGNTSSRTVFTSPMVGGLPPVSATITKDSSILLKESTFSSSGEIRIVDQNENGEFQTKVLPLPTQDDGRVVLGARGSIRIESFQNDPLFFDKLIEEQRKEFGNQDAFVGQSLVQRASSRINEWEIEQKSRELASEASKSMTEESSVPKRKQRPDTQNYLIAAENDLREAMMILANAADQTIEHLECLSLLTFVLQKQEKRSQASEFQRRFHKILSELSTSGQSEEEKSKIERARSRFEQLQFER